MWLTSVVLNCSILQVTSRLEQEDKASQRDYVKEIRKLSSKLFFVAREFDGFQRLRDKHVQFPLNTIYFYFL